MRLQIASARLLYEGLPTADLKETLRRLDECQALNTPGEMAERHAISDILRARSKRLRRAR